ncbi:MAG: hypothetical protein OXC18_02590 [Desulfurellaceae bacterium]|nr:hypothetical protein [Desulfurellaceae bacterium]
MHTPKLKGRILIGLCLAGMMTFGCAPSEQPEVASQQAESKEPEAVQMATDLAPLAPTDEYDVIDPDMSCEDANRFSVRAVERLGYEVTAFTPASDDAEGKIEAKQMGRWGGEEGVSITIACGPNGARISTRSDVTPCDQANMVMRQAVESSGFTITTYTPATLLKAGLITGEKDGAEPTSITITCYIERNRVEMDTSEDSPVLSNVDFYQALRDFQLGFFTAFNKLEERLASNPADQNRLYVALRPLNIVDNQVVFGTKELAVLPIKVNISNPTQQTYLLEIQRIMLMDAAGKRVKPISEGEAAFPAPSLTDRPVGPGASIQGYLYYPLGTYTGARGSLADQRNQEREGFSVEFKPW